MWWRGLPTSTSVAVSRAFPTGVEVRGRWQISQSSYQLKSSCKIAFSTCLSHLSLQAPSQNFICFAWEEASWAKMVVFPDHHHPVDCHWDKLKILAILLQFHWTQVEHQELKVPDSCCKTVSLKVSSPTFLLTKGEQRLWLERSPKQYTLHWVHSQVKFCLMF